MDRVKALYTSLSPSEKKAIRIYLDAFHLKGENKSIDFLKLIDRQPDISQEEASTKLYADSRSKAFIMMKGRLVEKITEFLTLSVNPDATQRDRNAPYHQDLVEYRRCMLFATSLQERQLSAMALEYFEKARLLAAKCNAPELEVDALIRLRGLDRSGLDKFEDLSIQIQKALKQQECDINATGLMRKFLSINGTLLGGDEDRIAFLEAHLPALEDSIRQVYSARADYFLRMMQLHLAYLTRSFEAGRGYIKQAIQILTEYAGIRSPIRMADTWFQLGRLELQDQHYPAAITALNKARSYQPIGSRAHLMTSLLMLYCHIYNRDLDLADDLLLAIESDSTHPWIRTHSLSKGLYTYLLACVKYLKGFLHEAWLLIQDSQDLHLDKETWATATRLFEVMILVDMEEIDMASQKLENLRKHMSRYNPNMRMRTIWKLLVAQERTGFAFAPVRDEEQHLGSLKDQYLWDVVGQEVIRFDEWYLERRAKKGKKK